MPVLGQGTWLIGEDPARQKQEIAAIRLGLDLGLSLIDTAEMYGEGAAEELVGKAIAGRRGTAYIVTKVYPHNATRAGAIKACERSLRRLGTDYIDCYLLHWRGNVPLSETMAGFEELRASGKIVDYGVSNFDVSDMEELASLTGGDKIVTNQVLYNLVHRGIEWDLLPLCDQKGIAIMAYSPLGSSGSNKDRLLRHATLRKSAVRHEATPAQIALAWLISRCVVAIPKAGTAEHVRENHRALEIDLTLDDLRALDESFPPPKQKVPLETS
jgi:diketogulonate reductase-like aldo/keto reductase